MIQKCRICRSWLDDEDHFCNNCGTENPNSIDVANALGSSPTPNDHREPSLQSASQASLYAFRCESCGASMSYDASAKALQCPFCGSQQMTPRQNARTLKPSAMAPFAIDRKQAEKAIRGWLSKGVWRPSDAHTRATISKISPVYVPFWSFSALAITEWTADISPPPVRARSKWYPVTNRQQNRHEGILVPASGILSQSEINGILPFDMNQCVAPEKVDTTDFVVEEFRLGRRETRPRALAEINKRETHQIQRRIQQQHRKLGLNVLLQEVSSQPVLLPVWITTYAYQRQLFRVLVNGQTGEVYGGAPISYTKVSLAFGCLFVFILITILFVILANA